MEKIRSITTHIPINRSPDQEILKQEKKEKKFKERWVHNSRHAVPWVIQNDIPNHDYDIMNAMNRNYIQERDRHCSHRSVGAKEVMRSK